MELNSKPCTNSECKFWCHFKHPSPASYAEDDDNIDPEDEAYSQFDAQADAICPHTEDEYLNHPDTVFIDKEGNMYVMVDNEPLYGTMNSDGEFIPADE